MTLQRRSSSEGYPLWHGTLETEGRQRMCPPQKMLSEGKGVRVRDVEGRWYLDARSSLRTLTLGYGDADIATAIARQAERLAFAEIIRYDRPSDVAVEYSRQLVAALPGHLTRIRFTSSGSRMVEEAVLLSRFVRVQGGHAERTWVIALDGAWHGTGGVASAVTGEPMLHDACGPLAPGVVHVPPEDIDAMDATIRDLGPDRVTAVIVEPFMGTRGRCLSDNFMCRVAALAQSSGIHVISDEITTGFGRMGSISHTDAVGVAPDLLILGKGLTSGYVPIAALAVSEDLYLEATSHLPTVFPHASTNDGHPLAMAAGLAVLEKIKRDDVLGNVRRNGDVLRKGLASIASSLEPGTRIDGAGFLYSLELFDGSGNPRSYDAMERLRMACEDHGMLIDRVLNYLVVTPPLIASEAECREVIEILRDVLVRT